MQQSYVELFNETSLPLRFALTRTIDGNVPSLEDEGIFTIKPSETKQIAWANEGTANLFVWDPENVLTWKGIIPAKVRKTIHLTDEGRKVLFDSMELPKDFSVTTSLSQNNPETSPQQFFYVVLALLFFFILACFGYYYFSKN